MPVPHDPRVPRPILLAGTEFVTPELPDGVTLIHPPQPQPGLRSVRAALRRALAEPLGSKPLAERVSERDRVLIVFDSPDFPVPPLREDPRGPAIAEILQTLRDRGLAPCAAHRRKAKPEHAMLKRATSRKKRPVDERWTCAELAVFDALSSPLQIQGFQDRLKPSDNL